MAGQFAQLDPAQLSRKPSVPTPTSVIVDYDRPNPLEKTTITVTSVFVGLAFFFAGIRSYIKIKRYIRRSWDDGMCRAHNFMEKYTLTFW